MISMKNTIPRQIFLIEIFIADCGLIAPSVTPLVWGGVSPNITEFPWHATMYYEQPNKSKKFFCGATIIQENLLITAAHCVYDDSNKRLIDANKIYVATGNVFRDYDSPLHDRRLVKKNKVCKYVCVYVMQLMYISTIVNPERFVLDKKNSYYM